MILTLAARTVLLGAILLAAGAPAAQAQQNARPLERIAAVVNDDVISVSDLQARTRLAILSSGLPDSPETRQRLTPQVLRALVDERLQMQEAKRLNITVPDQELEGTLTQIAEQNRLPRAQLQRFLAERGIPLTTLTAQVRANLAWRKIVTRKLRPSVQIGEEEINAALERFRANAGKPEYLVAEIFLAVDTPAQEDEVRRLADRLVEQLRQGANFAAIARQFSQAAGAAGGGDLGWVQQGQLPEDLDRALQMMRPGQLSVPVRSVAGWHIMLVRDQRTVSASANAGEARVQLKQGLFVVGSPAERNAVAQRAGALARNLNGCPAFEAKVREAGGRINDAGEVRISDMPPELGRIVANLPVGQASPPLGNEKQIVLLMVCSRSAPGGAGAPSRDNIANMLGNERLDMLQRRYLIDLRRAAFVELRV